MGLAAWLPERSTRATGSLITTSLPLPPHGRGEAWTAGCPTSVDDPAGAHADLSAMSIFHALGAQLQPAPTKITLHLGHIGNSEPTSRVGIHLKPHRAVATVWSRSAASASQGKT